MEYLFKLESFISSSLDIPTEEMGLYFMELNVSLFNILMEITELNSFIFLEFTIILKYIIAEFSLTADI